MIIGFLPWRGLVVVAAGAALAAGPATARRGSPPVAAAPHLVEIVLNPDRDTYLAENVPRPQGAAGELRVGFLRRVEHRAYLHFPLDPALHPPAGLDAAELWLYPEQLPNTGGFGTELQVRTLISPFNDASSYPPFLAAGEPGVVKRISTEVIAWKRFNVTRLAAEALADPGAYHGFEVSGTNPADEVRVDFVSREGDEAYPQGNQPRLVLQFLSSAFPSPTPAESPTATAGATATPDPTATPGVEDVHLYLPRAGAGRREAH